MPWWPVITLLSCWLAAYCHWYTLLPLHYYADIVTPFDISHCHTPLFRHYARCRHYWHIGHCHTHITLSLPLILAFRQIWPLDIVLIILPHITPFSPLMSCRRRWPGYHWYIAIFSHCRHFTSFLLSRRLPPHSCITHIIIIDVSFFNIFSSIKMPLTLLFTFSLLPQITPHTHDDYAILFFTTAAFAIAIARLIAPPHIAITPLFSHYFLR